MASNDLAPSTDLSREDQRPRLLVVADAAQAGRLGDFLKDGGLAVTLQRVSTQEELIAALRLRWDLAVLGSSAPGLGHRDAAGVLREHAPSLPHFVLVSRWSEAELRQAVTDGAIGFWDEERGAQIAPAVRRELEIVTERRLHRAAEAQRDQDRWLLGRLVDQVPFVIFVKDAEERKLRVANKVFADLFGTTKEWLLGKRDDDYFPPAQAKAFRADDDAVLSSGTMKEQDEVVRIGEEDRVVHTRKIPLLDDAGTPRYVMGISEDITARRQSEETLRKSLADLAEANRRLEENIEEIRRTRSVSARTMASYQQRALQMEIIRQQNEDLDRLVTELSIAKKNEEERAREAEEAVRLKSEFLANFSHEIRTPINAVMGYCDLLLRGEGERLTAHGRRDLNVIKTNARSLLALINDILDLSKIEAGRVEVAQERVDVRALVDDCLESVRELLRGKEVNVTATVADPARFLRTDGVKLKQVMVNLLSNAAKFTDAGEIFLRVHERDGGAVIQVEDTGMGIPAAQIPFIFDKFRQVDGSTTRKVGGTGLGLAIVKEMSRVLGGSVGVSSTLGRGSTFTVVLPGAIDKAGLAEEVARQERLRQERDARPGGTVLVVDDDPLIQNLIGGQLEPAGFRVLQSSTGEQALELARAQRPDVILLDLHLPGLDGWSVLAALKGAPDTAAIPVMLISLEEARARALSLGACEYLVKPVEPARVVDLVRRHLGDARRSGDVLVVDDDADSRELTCRSLSHAGFVTAEARDGQEALLKARLSRPALVVLDLMMPNLDGFEVLRHLRAEPTPIPVVVLTGKTLSEAERSVLRDGLTTYVQKGGDALEKVIEQTKVVLLEQSARRAKKRPRILYVEDNAQNREIVRRYLEASFEVLEAEDGEQGVARAHQERPDLILMDLSLPRMDGWEATRRIRQLPATERTPVIAVTGHAGREYQLRAQAAGCNAYMTKPIERAQLLEMIRKHLPTQP